MILGNLSQEGVPTISLEIAGRRWPAIIDTGFNGDLELPADLREVVNAHHVGRVTSVVAGGHVIEEDIFLVEMAFDGRSIEATATFSPIEHILVGTAFLSDYLLEISFPRKTVRLERQSDDPQSGDGDPEAG